MASVFLVQDPSKPENKTFYNDENLPPLPVPTVSQSVEKYLDSCRALLSSQQYEHTKQVCDKFVKEDAPRLQEKLMERAKLHKNWLEEWWQQKVYMEDRSPLPLVNFSGPGTYVEHYWPFKEGTQIERCASGTHVFMQMWNLVRKELIAAHKLSNGAPLTMHQFRYLFNTCRIPYKGRDELVHHFRTEAEGDTPTHIIVLRKGHIFKIPGTHPKTGEICSSSEFAKMFQYVYDVCENLPEGQGIAALTGMARDDWAEVRSHLVKLDKKNLEILFEIESSVIVASLDDCSPQNYSELSYEAMAGEVTHRWYDKSYTQATTKNGASLCNCDHSPYDAMVMVALVEFITHVVKQQKGEFHVNMAEAELFKPEELIFTLDLSAKKSIAEAKKQILQIRSNLEICQLIFDKFGKATLKQHKIHPDFMVQLCLQLAYMEVHGKPGPTYETAMTRQFYHGRTETCRTCTPEAVAFCRAMLRNPAPGTPEYKELHKLFFAAHNKFVSLMADCMLNKGCDRHLLGLLLICLENGYEIPEMYMDEAFKITGGNGSFVLSTSCVGYLHAQGGVAPMTEDGYGFFYRINDDKITYTTSAFRSCDETNALKLSNYLEYYFVAVLKMVCNSAASAKI